MYKLLFIFLIILFIVLINSKETFQTNTNKMKLDCVLTACNYNKTYSDFIPIFIKSWNILYPNTDVKIIFINDNIPNEYKKYTDNLILFKPLDNVSTAFTSQYIRLLYPCILNEYNCIMITDIDMIPMNNTYFTKSIENYTIDKFIYLRNVLINEKQIAMCYNIATPKVWSNIFNIKSLDDIKNRLFEVNKNINYVDGHNKSGWSTDQRDLYKYVMKWNKNTNNFISLDDNDTEFSRLDRIKHFKNNELENKIKKNIKLGMYSDYHCLRPFKKYEKVNNNIINLLI